MNCDMFPTAAFLLGVSGHLDFWPGMLPQLKECITARLVSLRLELKAGSTPYLVSGLARGADQLVAQCALEAGWKLGAILPAPSSAYLANQDFSTHPASAARLLELLAACQDKVMEMPWPPEQLDADIGGVWDQAYRNQSGFLANYCDGILALWDGVAAGTGACGTSHVVDVCRRPGMNARTRALRNRVPLEVITVVRKAPPGPAVSTSMNWTDSFLADVREFTRQV
jgi:hypothetical protein